MTKHILSLALVCGLAHNLSAQGSLSLDSCRRLAHTRNIRHEQKKIELDMATETRKAAFTNFFPSLSASAMHLRSANSLLDKTLALPVPGVPPISISIPGKASYAGLSLTQPIFAGGRIVNGNKLAKLGEEVAKLSIVKDQRDLDKQTDEYYWQIVRLQQEHKSIEAMEATLGSVRRDVESAVKAGVTTKNDLLRVQLREDELASAKLKLQHGVSTLKLLFAQHLGISTTGLELDHQLDKIASPLALYVDPEVALSQRIETEMLSKSVEAKRLSTKIERGKLLPSVALGGSYSYSNFAGEGKTNGVAYIGVSVPISDWWGGSHNLKKKRLEEKQSLLEQENNRQLMLIQIQKAWTDLEEAYKQTAITERSRGLAEENMRMMSEGYRSGVRTLSELLEAQSLLESAHTKHTQSLADYRLREGEYLRTVGK